MAELALVWSRSIAHALLVLARATFSSLRSRCAVPPRPLAFVSRLCRAAMDVVSNLWRRLAHTKKRQTSVGTPPPVGPLCRRNFIAPRAQERAKRSERSARGAGYQVKTGVRHQWGQ